MERHDNELNSQELALRREREARRLEALGVISLDGAEVLVGATVLRYRREDGEEELTLLDPNISVDHRLIRVLPHEPVPTREPSKKYKQKPIDWSLRNPI